MKTIIATIAILAAANSFAVSGCVDSYSGEAYKGAITEESRELSYSNCPADVLVNGELVARLIKVEQAEKGTACVYALNGVAFTCQRD